MRSCSCTIIFRSFTSSVLCTDLIDMLACWLIIIIIIIIWKYTYKPTMRSGCRETQLYSD